MLTRLLVAGAFVVCVGMSSLAGQTTKANRVSDQAGKGKKEEESQAKKKIEAAVEKGPGVYEVKVDDKGRITSCWVVGQAEINNTLGKVKGLQIAKSKSRLSAYGEYVKWLKAKVDLHEKEDGEVILFSENATADEETLKKSGKSVEKGSKKIEVIASNLVRGLEVIHGESKDGVYTVVYVWDAKKAKALEKD